MEVQDGFIVGVHNYCDSWCTRCPLTSHCRVFADMAAMEASLDPNLKAIAEAPPLPAEAPPPPPAWMQELAEADQHVSDAEWARTRPRIPSDHRPIDARARRYATNVRQWLEASESLAQDDDRQLAVVLWFHILIAVKINRALHVWSEVDPHEHEQPSDHDGSAKVALLGIDRSHAAWLELVERGVVADGESAPFVADLVWLGEALERARPKARDFVRPGFDEPDEVAKLLTR